MRSLRHPASRLAPVAAVLACAAALTAACERPAPAGDRADADAAALVSRLYRDYAWEAVEGAGGGSPDARRRTLADEPRAVLDRYFDRQLADLLVRDRACVERTGEICALEFAPLWASQDPAAQELTVRAAGEPGVVRVTYRYPANGQTIALTYQLTRTPAGWRVRDIDYANGTSLLALLAAGGEARDADAPPAAAAAAGRGAAPAEKISLACLSGDSLRAPGDTLRFSSLVVHDGTGDLLGTDLKLTRVGTGWGGVVGVAEGGPPEFEPLASVTADSLYGGFRATWGPGGGAELTGIFTCGSITAVRRPNPDAVGDADFLTRVPLERSRGRAGVSTR